MAFWHYPLKPILSLIQRDLGLRVGQYGKGSSPKRFPFCSISVPLAPMTQNDPEMTQKLPSFWIVDLSGGMRRKLGHKLGSLLGSDFALNDPEINGSNARVLGETG